MPLVQINSAAIKGEPGTGFESRIVDGVDKGPFECGNCEYFRNGDACIQKDMKARSKKPRHPNGDVVVADVDCCEYVDRLGKKKGGLAGGLGSVLKRSKSYGK